MCRTAHLLVQTHSWKLKILIYGEKWVHKITHHMNSAYDDSLLDSIVDILQHVLVKVFFSIYSLQIFLELLLEQTTTSYVWSQTLLESSTEKWPVDFTLHHQHFSQCL